MNVAILLTIVEKVGNDVFAIPICEKIDGSGWYDTYKCRSEPFEESSRGLVDIDISDSLKSAMSRIETDRITHTEEYALSRRNYTASPSIAVIIALILSSLHLLH